MSAQQHEAVRLACALEQGEYLLSIERDNTATELRRLYGLTMEWERKAQTWLASPEAAKRLDGYRELAQRLNTCEQQRDALLAALKAVKSWDVSNLALDIPLEIRKKMQAAIAKATEVA